MALNGVSEAFVMAAMSERQLQRYNWTLVVFSGLYILTCLQTIQYGAVGLILANCANMTCRILYRWVGDGPLLFLCCSSVIVLSLVLSAVLSSSIDSPRSRKVWRL